MIHDKCCFASVAAVLALLATPAYAEDIRRGNGLICDTVAQIDEFLKADDEGKNPLQAVNSESPVCGMGAVAYVAPRKLKEVLSKRGVFDVVEITVIGVAINGRFDLTTPFTQVTVFMAKGENT